MAKTTVGKSVDNLDMSFTDKPVENTANPEELKKTKEQLQAEREKAILGDNPEVFLDDGKRVWAKNKTTGTMLLFDRDGNEVTMETVDRLETAYPKYADRLDNGGKKKGDLKVRFTKEKFNEEKNAMETVEVPYEECDFIVERQDYADKDGNVIDAATLTIPRKVHSLVKLLRDEIGQEKV